MFVVRFVFFSQNVGWVEPLRNPSIRQATMDFANGSEDPTCLLTPSYGNLRQSTRGHHERRPFQPVHLQQARPARPFVLRAEHLDRQFGRIGVSRDAVLIEIFSRLLDFDVAGERGHDRLDEAFGLHLFFHLDHVAREHHRRRHDGVPIAEDQRVDALIRQAELDRVDIGDRAARHR